MTRECKARRIKGPGKEEAVIEVKHLTKQYGRHIAVSDLSFTIEKGRIYGLLGPNDRMPGSHFRRSHDRWI